MLESGKLPQLQIKEEVTISSVDYQDETGVDITFVTPDITSCPICGDEVNDELLYPHIQEHFDGAHDCKSCNLTFNNLNEYKHHIYAKHKGIEHVCDKCGFTFQYESLYNIHIERAHKEKSSVIVSPMTVTDHNTEIEYVCEKCCIKFSSEQLYKDHVLSHEQSSDVKNQVYSCEKCGLKFSFKSLYDFHIKHVHKKNYSELSKNPKINSIPSETRSTLDKTVHECEVCGLKFRYLSVYIIHTKNAHKENAHNDDGYSHLHKKSLSLLDNNIKCGCGIVFKYKELYMVHEQEAHSPDSQTATGVQKLIGKQLCAEAREGGYTCTICNKNFKWRRQIRMHTHEKKECPICKAHISKSNFTKHVVNHTAEPQICELCGAKLKNACSLRSHYIITHNTTVYKCEYCDKTFHKRYSYMVHKKRHEGDRQHVCETCGKTFVTIHHMNRHVRTAHLKLRPHICQYCKRAFSTPLSLRTHERQHTNETPYKCEVCGDGFRQNVSLRTHKKSKHGIVEAKTEECKICHKKFSSDQGVISHMRIH